MNSDPVCTFDNSTVSFVHSCEMSDVRVRSCAKQSKQEITFQYKQLSF